MSQILCRAVTKTLPISDALNYILIAKYHISMLDLMITPQVMKKMAINSQVTKTLWLTLAIKLAKKLAIKLEAYRGAKSWKFKIWKYIYIVLSDLGVKSWRLHQNLF